jgi:hypothetical protein
MDSRSGIGKVSYFLIIVNPFFAVRVSTYLSKSEKNGSKQVHDIIRKVTFRLLCSFAIVRNLLWGHLYQ